MNITSSNEYMSENHLKYHYVIFGDDWDLYKYSYSDVVKSGQAIYVPFKTHKDIKNNNLLYRIHFGKINRHLFRLPFKRIWCPLYYKSQFHDNKPICFVFTAGWVQLNDEVNISYYLHRHFNGCKTVWFLQDLFSVQRSLFTGRPLSLQRQRKLYDMILSYDFGDCEKYGFKYHGTVFSEVQLNTSDVAAQNCDVFFIAKYKGRLNLVLEIFEILYKAGLQCDFYLLGVPTDKQVYADKIHYIDAEMSYAENISHVINSKCILEIMQKGATGYTFRTLEAVTYGKLLITNNISILDAPFYDAISMKFIHCGSDIDEEMIKTIKSFSGYTNPYKKFLSPKHLLSFLDETV